MIIHDASVMLLATVVFYAICASALRALYKSCASLPSIKKVTESRAYQAQN